MTWTAVTLLALFAPLSSGCGPDGGRDPGETLTSTTATATEPGLNTSSTAGTGSSTAPTTSDSGVSDTATSGTGGTTMMAPTSSTGDDTTQGSSGSGGSSGTGGVKLDLPDPVDKPIPVHDIPGLESITFYESTSGVAEFTFLVAGPELNSLLADPLSQQNRDIEGTSVEFYDVYYSNEDGTFNPDGSYLSIGGSFGAKLPAGGGLNLAEISLNYADDSVEFGSFLASFQGLGDNYVPGSEPNAIDGNLDTHTTMGNNVDQPGQRLRVTLGFKSSLMPG
ncbi:MAG: hypothetical protein H0T76_04890 [Nannocystis sp.]|nr:hypothetical protein [Nannocystis sp.]MBA3545801.1 hypothetical protein [Nannocystis sp.]